MSGAGAASDDMETLIPVINKLQDVFNTVGEAKVKAFLQTGYTKKKKEVLPTTSVKHYRCATLPIPNTTPHIYALTRTHTYTHARTHAPVSRY